MKLASNYSKHCGISHFCETAIYPLSHTAESYFEARKWHIHSLLSIVTTQNRD